MTTGVERMQLLLIDRQPSWLARSVQALQAAGFEVDSLDHYGYPPTDEASGEVAPKLVILGCASIGSEEIELIKRVVDHKDHLLVLSTSLPLNLVRNLFLAGADDVANKPYDPVRLIKMVNQVLNSIPEDDR